MNNLTSDNAGIIYCERRIDPMLGMIIIDYGDGELFNLDNVYIRENYWNAVATQL